MSARPFHKRYHSDALAGFMPLSLEERGAYQTVLDMIYDAGGPIVDNDRLLAGYMQCSIRKWRMVRDSLLLKRKIKVTDDGRLSNSRAEFELENDAKTARKLAENGSKGGHARAEKLKNHNENSEGGEAELEQGSGLRARSRNQSLDKKEASSGLDTSGTPEPPNPAPPLPRGVDLQAAMPDDLRQVMVAANMTGPPSDTALLRDWLGDGISLEHSILPTVRQLAERENGRGKSVSMLKYFDRAIRDHHADEQREIERLRDIATQYQPPPERRNISG